MFCILVKCYLRKGNALMAMKDLGQAMATFGKALEIDPNCQVNINLLIYSKTMFVLLLFRKQLMVIDNVQYDQILILKKFVNVLLMIRKFNKFLVILVCV